MMAAMRWNRRILGTMWVVSVALAVLVFVAAISLGVRSHLYADRIRRDAFGDAWISQYGIGHLHGSVVVKAFQLARGPDGPGAREGVQVKWSRRAEWLPVRYFTWSGSTAGFAYEHRSVAPLHSG
jgi:hypothetical protein